MIPSEQLIQMGKNLSSDFVQKNVNMTEELTKLAEAHGLNKEQLFRIAETANVESYLKLIDKTSDKYLEFPIADAKLAHDTYMQKTATEIPEKNEYEDLPIPGDFSFALYGKVAALEDTIDLSNVNLNFAVRLLDTVSYIQNHWLDKSAEFTSGVENIFDQSKQFILDNTSFNDLKEIIKTAAPNIHEDLSDIYQQKLEKSRIKLNLEKTANTKEVNTASKYFQDLEKLDHQFIYLTKIANIITEYINSHNDFVKGHENRYLIKEAGMISEFFKTWKKYPRTTTLVVAAPIAYMLGRASMPDPNDKSMLDLDSGTRAAIQAQVQQWRAGR